LAIQEFNSFVNSGVERVREAYTQGRQEGVKLAAQVLADGRKRLKKLPGTVRDEMRTLYGELELTLTSLAVARLPAGVE
jgi:hypothetical protein